jgi:drug/metabolite transporter (DMT)-like permease
LGKYTTTAKLQQQWLALSSNTRGTLWIVAACACFGIMAVCVKFAGRTLPVWELLVLRTVFALLFLAPVCYRVGARVLETSAWRVHLVRSALGVGGATSFYFAVAHLDLALVTTLSFTRTLFVIVLAVLFLGESVKWRRSLATLAGFLGVLICIQPGTETFEPWALAALSFALFSAGVTTAVKKLTVTESPLTILLYTYVFMGLMTLGPALFIWHAPSPIELALMAALALFSILGQGCMVHGLRAGEVTALAPVEYVRLLFSALFGYLFFNEIAQSSTWAGAAVIIGSTLYIAVREAQLSRRSADSSIEREPL